MVRLVVLSALALLILAAPAAATPVCTDGYKGGPPASACGGRIFPEAALARGVFGAPSYVIGDEIFWGQDRLDFVERHLARG